MDQQTSPPDTHFATLKNIPDPQTKADSHAQHIKGYYVIIGCGTAAVVDHTTLRQTEWGKTRLADPRDKSGKTLLPVMHIGFKDPWWHYFTHGMGQPPYLLTMPGYHQRPSQETDVFHANPGCRSDRFAACTQNEWGLLWAKYHKEDPKLDQFSYKEGWVAVIESKTIKASPKVVEKLQKEEKLDISAKLKEDYDYAVGDPPYRLLVVVPTNEKDKKLEFVYAYKIDICTGAGRARVPPEDPWPIGRTKLWVPPRMWEEETRKRKLVNGPEALHKETIWYATDRIYVHGGGGIGLNMVERAEGEGCFVDWLTTGTLHASFNLPRNDIVLKHPINPSDFVKKAPRHELTEFLWREVNIEDLRGRLSDMIGLIVEKRATVNFDTKEALIEALKGVDKVTSIPDWEKIVGMLYDVARLPATYCGKPMQPGESKVRVPPFMAPTNTKAVLTPAYFKWRFGRGSDPKIVRLNNYVVVKIEGAKNRNKPSDPPAVPFIRDYYESDHDVNDKGAFPLSGRYKKECPELSRLKENEGAIYDRICITTGIEAGELGTPATVAAGFTLDPLRAPDGRTVALQADNGAIRLLGAAAQAHPSDRFKIAKPGQVEPEDDPASRYFFSLPMSAVVPGFIFTGVNIALANHYFDWEHPNVNINTMTTDELKSWIHTELMNEPIWEDRDTEKEAEVIAVAVVKNRRLRNGYETPGDITKALEGEASLQSIPSDKVAGQLQTNYSPARDFLD